MATQTSNSKTPRDPAPDGYYTTAELRRRWGCGRTKLYEVLDSPGFPEGIVVGRTRLFPRHEVWAWEVNEDAA